MTKLFDPLCGKEVELETIHEHRLKCYVKGTAYGHSDKEGKRWYTINGKRVPEPAAVPIESVVPEDEQ